MKVFILPTKASDAFTWTKQLELLQLEHPVKKVNVQCAFHSPSNKLFLVQKTESAKNISFLAGNKVISDGSFYFITPIDPLFIVLPLLEQLATSNENKFQPFGQLLFELKNGSLQKLRNSFSSSIGNICDINDSMGDDMLLVRFSKTNTLKWLKKKYEILFEKFKGIEEKKNRVKLESEKSESFCLSTDNLSSNGTPTATGNNKNTLQIARQCFEYMAEFVETDLLKQLFIDLVPGATSLELLLQLTEQKNNKFTSKASSVDDAKILAEMTNKTSEVQTAEKNTEAERMKRRKIEEKRKIANNVKMKSIGSFFKKK